MWRIKEGVEGNGLSRWVPQSLAVKGMKANPTELDAMFVCVFRKDGTCFILPGKEERENQKIRSTRKQFPEGRGRRTLTSEVLIHPTSDLSQVL